MRKLVVYTLTTIDGAVDDPNRAFPAPEPADGPAPPTFDEDMLAKEAELIARQDTVLLGRKTYEEWGRFWPDSDEQPFTDFINHIPKLVVSHQQIDLPWGPAALLTEPLSTAVRALRQEDGGDIGVHGSISVAQALLEEGLVDELHLLVAPVVDPQGRRLFENAGTLRRYELTESRTSRSGALLLTYQPRVTHAGA